MALSPAGIGCKQQCYMTECGYTEARSIDLPPNLDTDPALSTLPAHTDVPPPPNSREPERKARYLSLAEAIAIALEHGTPGTSPPTGTTNDSLVSFSNPSVVSPENSLRVLSLNPAIVASNMEISLSKFDVRWQTSMNWQRTDQPVGGNNPDQNFQNGDAATFATI